VTQSLIVNGVSFETPEPNDTNWGAVTSAWMNAINYGVLQKAGGLFTLLADTNFGATYGLISNYYKSNTGTNIGTAGVVRLAATDTIDWYNASGDLALSVNGSKQLTFNGTALANAGNIVIGPSTSTNGAIPTYGTTTGNTLLNTGVLIDSSNNITGVNALTGTSSFTAASFIPTGITKPTNGMFLQSTNILAFSSNNIEFAFFDTSSATFAANNGFLATGAFSSTPTSTTFIGMDAAAGFGRLVTSGTMPFNFYTESFSAQQFQVAHTGSSVNFISVTGAAAGTGVTLTTKGSDTNVSLQLSTQGTGSILGITPTAGDNSTKIATTAFIATSYAPLASPALTGNPTAPTQSSNNSSTRIATTAFVNPANSLGGNGYQKLSSGLILQWGLTTSIANGSALSVTYPTTFASATYSVTATATSNSSANCPVVTSAGTASFSLSNITGVSQTFWWMAVGT
jgi:hypothetical protein